MAVSNATPNRTVRSESFLDVFSVLSTVQIELFRWSLACWHCYFSYYCITWVRQQRGEYSVRQRGLHGIKFCLCCLEIHSDKAHLLDAYPLKHPSHPVFLCIGSIHEEINCQESDSFDEEDQGSRSHFSSQASYSRSSSEESSRPLKNRSNERRENERRDSMSSQGSRGQGKEAAFKAAQKIRKLQEELAKTQREKENLERAAAKKKGKKGVPLAIPLKEEVRQAVETKAGEELWRTCKFLASEDQLLEATYLVMKLIPEANVLLPHDVGIEDPEVEQIVRNFMKTYGAEITKKLNAKRNSSQSGIVNEYVKRAAEGKPMPTPAQLLTVVKRKGLYNPRTLSEDHGDFIPEEDLNRNRSFFQWYWDRLLPKVAGKKRWGGSKRHYGGISSMTYPDDPKKKYITTSDEALVVLIYENCGQRMPYSAKCKEENVTVDKTHVLYQSKYTTADEGQIQWGGWDYVGRERYIKVRDALKAAKKRLSRGGCGSGYGEPPSTGVQAQW